MRRIGKVFAIVAVAACLTLMSSVVPAWVVTRNPGDMGCEPACEVVAGGWPFPYLVDSLHLSPGGSVSLPAALFLGLDEFWYDALCASFVCWLGIVAGLAWLHWRGRLAAPLRGRGSS